MRDYALNAAISRDAAGGSILGRLLRNFIARAYRRPVQADEADRFIALPLELPRSRLDAKFSRIEHAAIPELCSAMGQVHSASTAYAGQNMDIGTWKIGRAHV